MYAVSHTSPRTGADLTTVCVKHCLTILQRQVDAYHRYTAHALWSNMLYCTMYAAASHFGSQNLAKAAEQFISCFLALFAARRPCPLLWASAWLWQPLEA